MAARELFKFCTASSQTTVTIFTRITVENTNKITTAIECGKWHFYFRMYNIQKRQNLESSWHTFTTRKYFSLVYILNEVNLRNNPRILAVLYVLSCSEHRKEAVCSTVPGVQRGWNGYCACAFLIYVLSTEIAAGCSLQTSKSKQEFTLLKHNYYQGS